MGETKSRYGQPYVVLKDPRPPERFLTLALETYALLFEEATISAPLVRR